MHHSKLILIQLLALCSLVHVHGEHLPTLPLQSWKFTLTDKTSQTPPAMDSAQEVTIPHDWSWIKGPVKNGVQKDKGGYRIGGVGWYQTKFELPESFSNKTTFIHFDGIYRRSTIFLNGKKIGGRPYGFISFRYDLSPYLKEGQNTIAVQADCSLEPSSRWYHPCGIFAPVYLEAVPSGSRFVHDGIFITTPQASPQSAQINITAEIEEPENLQIKAFLTDPAGHITDTTSTEALETSSLKLSVSTPKLWSPQTPSLYKATLQLWRKDQLLDERTVPFGIRSIKWDTKTGFSLNGQVTKLKGVCEHLTGGPVGGAWPEPLLEWKLQLLKDMGCNAIRTAHNPQIPAFYKLCDQLGILVMDEAFDGWSRKAPQDYGALDFENWWKQDLTDWVRRDRNHPCVIIRSVGNETRGQVGKDLVAMCKENDPTRPVTSGHSASQFMEVYGVNGHSESQKFYKEKRPDKPFIATEAPHTWQVRGFYKTKTWYRDGFPNRRQAPFETPDLTPREIFTNAFLSSEEMTNRKQIFLSSYDNAYVRINARQNWEKMRDLPWYAGHFRWTGFDYPGEASYVHGGWPFHSFAGGALDLAGFKKDLYYLYRSQWQKESMVHILPHWTHPRMEVDTLIPVVVYTNAEEVELLHNGKSLGRQKTGKKWDEMACQFMVPWQAGEISAIARTNNREVARQTIRSSKHPSTLQVTLHAALDNYSILDLSLADSAGTFYPYGENKITVATTSPTRILALENGHPADVDPPVSNSRRAFMGKARLFLEGPSSPITVGAIIGERRQLTSNLVSIEALRITSTGQPLDFKPKIHYTLDDSLPTQESPLYEKSFPVDPKQTVRAIVYHEGQSVLELKETFSPTAGLHWSSADEFSEMNSSNALQAENAENKGGKKKKEGANFHGTGYLDFEGREGQVTFYQENDGLAGQATLEIRYSHNDKKRKRPLEIFLNDQRVKTLAFPHSGSWNKDWKVIKLPVKIRKGANTLTLKSTGASFPNLDEIEFK